MECCSPWSVGPVLNFRRVARQLARKCFFYLFDVICAHTRAHAMSLAMASTIGVPSVTPRAPARARRGSLAATRAAMPKAKGKAAAGQKTMTSTGFYPMLPKPAVAVGKCSSVLGKFWSGCPSKDKDKRFKCAVIEFIAA